ncbi:MAG: bifunctional folylpolyglutamate synthase/dihydrofolate synthase [Halothiobacillaceae bacterium]
MDPALSGWLGRLEALDVTRIELGLGRVAEVFIRLDPFPRTRPLVITVAGTNGKGSTVAFLEAILMAAGHRVVAYVSPHLNDFRERIRFDGHPIESSLLVSAFERVEAARESTPLTYFEYATLAALAAAGEQPPDVLLLEVGLGGRLDAVNVMDADIAVITRIGIDHAQWLGNDIEAIAGEKAGILRPGRPAVYSARPCPEAVRERAEALGAPLHCLGAQFDALRVGDRLHWAGACRAFDLPLPALPGDHQVDNAAGAVMACQLLPAELVPSDAALAEGLIRAVNPGRGEIIKRDGITTVLDVAHNPQGCAALRSLLADHVRPTGRVWAVLGVLSDKDPAGMAAELVDSVDGWYLAGICGARGMGAETLTEKLAGVANLQIAGCDSDPVHAYNQALCGARPGDVLLVFGSFMAVAAVRGHLTGRK